MLLALLLLGACARPLSCPGESWDRAGYRDGASGRGLAFFDRYAAICAEAGIAPDREQWLSGHERGIARYCTVRNAYRVGFRGYGYFNIEACPPEDAERLDQAHYEGYIDREVIEDQRLRWRYWPYWPYYPHYPFYPSYPFY